MIAQAEKRLQVLEEKFEYQDNTIDALNDVIIDQQNQITKLEERLNRLESMLLNIHTEAAIPGGEEPPPPHY